MWTGNVERNLHPMDSQASDEKVLSPDYRPAKAMAIQTRPVPMARRQYKFEEVENYCQVAITTFSSW